MFRKVVRFNQSKFGCEGVNMSEEEKMKIAIDLAKQRIDLEEIEKSCLDLAKWFKPVIDLAVKNKKILDKYTRSK